MRAFVLPALVSTCLALPAMAGDLDSFLRDLNLRARADVDAFGARVAVEFGVPHAEVRAVLGQVAQPADAFLVFQLGRWTSTPPDRVLRVYGQQRKKGWGAVAKELGIKPGSREFHALKQGAFSFDGGRPPGRGEERGEGRGEGRGHGRGKGRGQDKDKD